MEKDLLYIDKYLRGELDEMEQIKIEKRLNEDTLFLEKYKEQESFFKVLGEEDAIINNYNDEEVLVYKSLFASKEAQELKKKIKREHERFMSNKKTKNKYLKVIFSITVAASLLLVFLVEFNNSTTLDYTTLMEGTTVTSAISRGDNDKELGAVKFLFEAKKYKETLANIQKIPMDNSAVYIYKGISELELNKYDKAFETFNKLRTSELLDAPKSNWYIALLYIKKNDLDKAKKQLNVIVSKKLYNYKKAKEILDNL